jgi:membrane protease YdiL (CAAX protease family)
MADAAPDTEGRTAKTAFHWALAGILLPGVGFLASLSLAAVYGVRGGLWGRRLLVLGGVDLLVAAVLIWVTAAGITADPPEPVRPMIGVVFSPDDPGRAVVATLIPGMPAEEAGLRPGDVLKAVDGLPPTSMADAVRMLRDGGVQERVLTIERAEEGVFEVRVAPRPHVVPARRLFEVAPPQAGPSGGWQLRDLAGLAVPAAVILATWLASRRRPGPRAWRGFLLSLSMFIGGSFGAVHLMKTLQGGLSRGGVLISIILADVGLMLGALLAAAWLRSDRPAEPPPAMSRGRAMGLAFYYVLTSYPRMAILLFGIDRLAFGGTAKPGDALDALAQTLHGPAGVVLFVLAVAVVGPIAEEIVFRGQLLPRLAARLGRGPALLASSVLFGSIHSNYGLYAGLVIVLGWGLGWARLASGGLAVPIALHVLFNGAVTALFFLRKG